MGRYSALRVLTEGLKGQTGWGPAWRSVRPKPRYDVIIVGGGGHGLATAYYLAKKHGVTNVAVLEAGWIGGGNTGRNTTIVRSNYYYPQSIALYDLSVKLYEKLSVDLNYNVMFSQRGMIISAHSRHDMENAERLVRGMQINGLDVRMMDRAEIAARVPALDCSPNARFPVWGGFCQDRAGPARHDAVVWGYARAADSLGVDIVQNCRVTGFRKNETGRIIGVETSLGDIACDKAAIVVAGHSSELGRAAGFELPITSYALQAFVTEPIKPTLDVVSWSLATGVYISQSDKGGLVFGGALDLYPSYAQRGNLPIGNQVIGAIADLYPSFGRVRLLRHWAGIVDVVHDSSPIIGESPVPGLYMNCGWGTGGFKAIPAGGLLLAHHLATGQPHPIAEPFQLNRFHTGALIDEAAGAGIAH
ncbi:MAG: sarcosine oxidase subunit beta family protein [Hyphomonadaceae bacterium JAD_PAG50586_4]|jgi:sarcosine oxidase subunit beta|nr:MAG: sarcosine oxidase subunit beta family protein [Hyphomonadaceae bacterium JAD_PAG50586_4]